MRRPAHVLDVLRDYFGEAPTADAVRRLTPPQMSELADRVNQFYDSWEAPTPQNDTFRVHLGGWVALNAAAPAARDMLNTALLYAHEVAIQDPVAAWVDPARRRLTGLPPARYRTECRSKARSLIYSRVMDGPTSGPRMSETSRTSLALCLVSRKSASLSRRKSR
jgi:hypothetical protein